MCKLKVRDFYYGAFLSALLNTPDRHLVLFDGKGKKDRRIYCLETNLSGELFIYAKCKTGMYADTEGSWHWAFQFSADEVEKIQDLYREKGNVRLALICIKKSKKRKKDIDGIESVEIELAESELAFVDYKNAMECLGVNIGTKTNQIDIKTYPNKKGLRMYGSGRSVELNGKDNTLVVPRNALDTL